MSANEEQNERERRTSSWRETTSAEEPNERYPLLPEDGTLPSHNNFRALQDGPEKGDGESISERTSFMETIVHSVAGTMGTIYESAQDAVGDVSEVVQDVAEIVKVTIAEEVHEVAEVLVEELQEADDGDLYFLEMGLTRNLSILPADVTYAAENNAMAPPKSEIENEPIIKADGETDFPKKEETASAAPPMMSYFMLATAVSSLSSIGPLLDLQQDTTSTTKLFWRMAGTSMVLFPTAVLEVRQSGLPNLNMGQWIVFLLSTTFYDTMCLGFVLALNFTSVGNAVILSNSQALLLLLGKLFIGDPVSLMEGTGAIVAFSGALLCSKDSSEGSPAGSSFALTGRVYHSKGPSRNKCISQPSLPPRQKGDSKEKCH